LNYYDIIHSAIKAREMAYTPYSHFNVGAAVEMEGGKIYSGCNIENASYGATNCAERTAIFKAVSEGHKKISTIAVVGADDAFTFPCGICRQVIAEFSTKDTMIIIAKNENDYIVKSLDEILPGAFTKAALEK
jgi:cytidine deaminase